ncbi:hypothetical protein PY650_19320 [Rhizobium calliandrae]|uniref:ABC transporter permease n=1 Tax=Rhizobium calliandrae TaxID=1312182 RepID=A0ABT7KGN1_9HYPH|nr:hypothetical protein [Rhizobium calliandrae]MDL2407770.1 hypothetical protein [Rhizobium calliandrae]
MNEHGAGDQWSAGQQRSRALLPNSDLMNTIARVSRIFELRAKRRRAYFSTVGGLVL